MRAAPHPELPTYFRPLCEPARADLRPLEREDFTEDAAAKQIARYSHDAYLPVRRKLEGIMDAIQGDGVHLIESHGSRAFLAATLPKGAKRISSVGNGPIVTKDSEAHEGEKNTFYESASFAKTVPKSAPCSGIRPGIFLVYTEGDKGSGPSGVQVFSEYLATCYSLTL